MGLGGSQLGGAPLGSEEVFTLVQIAGVSEGNANALAALQALGSIAGEGIGDAEGSGSLQGSGAIAGVADGFSISYTGAGISFEIGPLQKPSELADTLRIVPKNWTSPSGLFVMCLGSDTPGRFARVKDGDRLEVTQQGNFADEELMQITAHMRGPDSMPANTHWFFEITVNSGIAIEREIRAGEELDLFDLGLGVLDSSTDLILGFRLSFRADDPTTVYEVEIPAFYIDALNIQDLA